MKKILIICAIMMAFFRPAVAQEADIQATISSQIEAFLENDFETAFTYAAPNIKKMFGTPERFGVMVKNGYPMVHRSSTFKFTELREIAGTMYQKVLIQDQLGAFYLLDYAMLETPEGWQIRGVQLLQTAGVGA